MFVEYIDVDETPEVVPSIYTMGGRSYIYIYLFELKSMCFCDGKYYGGLELKVVSHFLGTLGTSFSLFCKDREIYGMFVYHKAIRYQLW